MNWKKLKSNKCPECGKGLEPVETDGLIFCEGSACGFKIHKDKLVEIVSIIVLKEIDKAYS